MSIDAVLFIVGTALWGVLFPYALVHFASKE